MLLKKSVFRLSGILIIFLLSLNLNAQMSQEGMPPSFTAGLSDDNVENISFPAPGNEVISRADIHDGDGIGPYRIGKLIDANININTAGTWTDIPGLGRIWRLCLESDNAKALSLYYDNFFLPEGSELYIYNESKDHLIGAFTDLNNTDNGLFATEIIQGDKLTLEYFEPEGLTSLPEINISHIAYIFRGVNFSYLVDETDGGSAWCMINVNCQEGDNWQIEKKGVVRQYMILPEGWVAWCSGSMINNTSWDLTPYILTAHHCGEGCSSSHLNQWIFYFKYEASNCSGTSGPTNFTMLGCSLKAEGDRYTGSDFALFELNGTPSQNLEPYWNGWNRTNTPSTSGVSIHHPLGDIKKISTYNTQLGHSQWNNNGVLSHWRATWAATYNGTSIVEEGSSGSPLFDSEHRIVGDLGGSPGNQSCENTSYSLYGKVYWSWDQMGSAPTEQLKYWLDPANTGEQYLPGTDGNNPQADFEADDATVPPGSAINFSDLSMGNPETWNWTFPGGNPSSSTDQNPEGIVYANPGSYSVTLTISNMFGSDTETKYSYIEIDDAPDADFAANHNEIGVGGTVTFTDESSGSPNEWHWQFEGGSPSVSFNQNPAPIHYYEAGIFKVALIATNDFGTDTEVKQAFITVYDTPEADFVADSTLIPVDYAVNFTDSTNGLVDTWEWAFEGAVPSSSIEQNPQNITYPQAGTFAVSLSVSGDYGSHDTTKTGYITVVPPPEAEFSAFNRYIVLGNSASFLNQSSGDPDTFLWEFEGGEPSTANTENPPAIYYNTEGDFDVSLSVESLFGSNTITKTDYIHVGHTPEAAFEADNTTIVEGESVNFTDMSTENPFSWSWEFEGGDPATSNEQHPEGIVYPNPGVYDVSLSINNGFGQSEHTETDYIFVGYVGIDEAIASDDNIFLYPNPTNGLLVLDVAANPLSIKDIILYNAYGMPVLTMASSDQIQRHNELDLSHLPTAVYYLHIRTDNNTIIRKVTLSR